MLAGSKHTWATLLDRIEILESQQSRTQFKPVESYKDNISSLFHFTCSWHLCFVNCGHFLNRLWAIYQKFFNQNTFAPFLPKKILHPTPNIPHEHKITFPFIWYKSWMSLWLFFSNTVQSGKYWICQRWNERAMRLRSCSAQPIRRLQSQGEYLAHYRQSWNWYELLIHSSFTLPTI